MCSASSSAGSRCRAGATASGRTCSTYAPLPVLLAVMVGLAPQTRLYRSFLLDELGQDYVRTARAKGMTEGVVLFRHVLRNAMIPILTNIGLQLPGIFVGSFLIEVFFSIPGLGREVLLAVNRSDFPVIQAVTDLPGGADDVHQPAHRPGLQGRRPAGGAQMSARPSRRRRRWPTRCRRAKASGTPPGAASRPTAWAWCRWSSCWPSSC